MSTRPGQRKALLLDTGSPGDLPGSRWVADMCKVAVLHQRKPEHVVRPRLFEVMGVGKGTHKCTHDNRIPLALRASNDSDGNPEYHAGMFEAPKVTNSALPAIIGLETMTDQRALLDLVNDKLHLCGPDDFNPLCECLPPGIKSFDIVRLTPDTS